MSACYEPGDFKMYFDQNMKGLGLKVPDGLFESMGVAIGNTIVFLEALKSLGAGATLTELALATSNNTTRKVKTDSHPWGLVLYGGRRGINICSRK